MEGSRFSHVNLSSKEVIAARKDRLESLSGDRMDVPIAVILAGQQGAGKSAAQEDSLAALKGKGVSVVSYDGDDNVKFHPRYEKLMLQDDLAAHFEISTRMSFLHKDSIDHMIERRLNVIASHPMQKTEWAHAWVDRFRSQGYNVSVVYVATPDSTSLLGAVDRFQHDGREKYGYGRWVDPDFHDETYREIPDVAHELESTDRVDSIYVVSRDGDLLHQNHLGSDGVMRSPLGAREAIVAERNRPKTGPEIADFAMKLERSRANAPEWAQSTLDDAEKRHKHHLAQAEGGADRTVQSDRQEGRQTLQESLRQPWTPERVSSSAAVEPQADGMFADSAQGDGSWQGASELVCHAGVDDVSDRAALREQTYSNPNPPSRVRDVAGEDRELVDRVGKEYQHGSGVGQSASALEPRKSAPRHGSGRESHEQAVEKEPHGEPDLSGEAYRRHRQPVPGQSSASETDQTASGPAGSRDRRSGSDHAELERASVPSEHSYASSAKPDVARLPEAPEPAERTRGTTEKLQRVRDARDEASGRNSGVGASSRGPERDSGRDDRGL